VWFQSFLTSEVVGVCGQLHIPEALTPGREPPLHIEYEVGWGSAHSSSGCFGTDKNLSLLPAPDHVSSLRQGVA
jgi:hypothetical protein